MEYFSFSHFSPAKENYKFPTQYPDSFTEAFSDFVRKNYENVSIYSSGEMNPRDFSKVPSTHFLIAVGDQSIKYPTRLLNSAEDIEAMNAGYRSGMLLGIHYFAIAEHLYDQLFKILNEAPRPDHNLIFRIVIGPVSDSEIAGAFDIPNGFESKITELAKGNYGAAEVLTALARHGSEVFEKIAPKLGQGFEIYHAYVACNSDVDALIEKYKD